MKFNFYLIILFAIYGNQAVGNLKNIIIFLGTCRLTLMLFSFIIWLIRATCVLDVKFKKNICTITMSQHFTLGLVNQIK